MFVFGAAGGALTGKDDIFYVMKAQGLIIPALIVLGANIWTTNDNGLYNGGLSLSNLTGIRKKPLVIAAGILGTLVSMWLYEHFVSWLTFLNAALPPVGAVLITEYFLNREVFLKETEPADEINPGALFGVIAGILAGSFLPWGITSVNAMLAACLADFIYMKAKGKSPA